MLNCAAAFMALDREGHCIRSRTSPTSSSPTYATWRTRSSGSAPLNRTDRRHGNAREPCEGPPRDALGWDRTRIGSEAGLEAAWRIGVRRSGATQPERSLNQRPKRPTRRANAAAPATSAAAKLRSAHPRLIEEIIVVLTWT